MTQKHYAQQGTFHITTNTKGKVPWLTLPSVPEIIIDNLCMTRNTQNAKIFSFCILPNHMHILMSPGERGLSRFMQSFKKNSARDVGTYLGKYSNMDRSDFRITPTVDNNHRSGESKFAAYKGSSTSAIVTVDTIQWQNGFYDERVRDPTQRSNVLSYIKYNAVSHHLVDDIEQWSWSSLHYKHLLDPMEIWFDSPYDPS